MGPPPPGDDPWDLDRLRVPAGWAGGPPRRRPPPRHRPGDAFIKGPIPYTWVASACQLPGAGLRIAMAFRFLCARFRGENRWGLDKVAEGLRISRDSTRRGLNAAELAGLLSVSREPGCKLAVSVLDLPNAEPGVGRRPLHGPIPWDWWRPASRLPGQALQVAAACWLIAGWERSAVFKLSLGGWAELGLTRFSAGRGLGVLEAAELVSVTHRPGLPPVVALSGSRPE